MTLLERTQILEARAKRQREHEARETIAERIRDRTKHLEKYLKRLAVARARATALEEAGHERAPWPAPPVAAFSVYDLKGVAPVSVESTRQAEWEKFVLALGKFVEKTERTVAQDVRRAKKSALEGVSSEDLRGYLGDPSTENQGQQLLNILERLEQKNWEALPGPELLQVSQQARVLREAVVCLRETGASEELLRFLTLARNDGAPLDALTDTLHSELETRKLLGRLRIFFK